MCDYSLMEFPNRLAVEGEVLMVHRFRSGSLGLASPADCMAPAAAKPASIWQMIKDILFLPQMPQPPAVCIPPGARLMLHELPVALQRRLKVSVDEEVKFVQLSAAENQHRDAIRFRTGDVMRLQELSIGQRVEVIDLGNSEVDEPTALNDLETVPAGRSWRG